VVATSALSLSVSCDMKLHSVLLGWRRLLTKPCVSPQVAARQVIHRLLRRRESLLMEVEVAVGVVDLEERDLRGLASFRLRPLLRAAGGWMFQGGLHRGRFRSLAVGPLNLPAIRVNP
jgi:hypothetical protein